MISLLLIFIAAVCKAFSDTLDHHFDTSIFRGWSRKWFDPNVTIKSVPTIFNYPLDGWHISNSVQLVCWLCLPVVYSPVEIVWVKSWMEVCAGGLFFNLVFNTFYNKIFR